MACTTITEFLQKETGRFEGEIYRRMFPRSPWIAFVKKQPWTDGVGNPVKNITFEPRAPTDYSGWTDTFATLPTASGSCLPTPKAVTAGSTAREWNLQQMFLEGPDFCVTDIRTRYEAATQLERIVEQLTNYSMTEWEFRYRHEFLRLSGTKVVLLAASTAEGTGADFDGISGSCPGSRLTQGVLDKYKARLIRNGAVLSAITQVDGSPALMLITEMETSDDLIRQNADIRQDIRWAAPNMLLESIGHDRRTYRGYLHVLDHAAIHYTCAGGAYTEVFPFSDTAATVGNKSILNTSWLTAPYTTSHIFDQTVFTSRIPNPIGQVGPVNFTPVNYTTGAGGSWQLKNILSRDCNPDGTIVFHRGHLMTGSEPVHPERGVSFVHLRCDPDLLLITACS